MHGEKNEMLRASVEALPASKMVRPSSFGDQLKYVFWTIYTPYHPHVRDTLTKFGLRATLVRLGIMRHKGRQDYLLGTIASGYSVEDVISHLIEQGYGNHFVAWKDSGEIVSLRYVENFSHQYHLRIFEDGEIRGHYEHTPECHPLKHLKEVGQESRHEHFLMVLGEKITPHHSISQMP